MSNMLDNQINIKLTVKELEDITLALRMVDKIFGGDTKSELENRLSNIVKITKLTV